MMKKYTSTNITNAITMISTILNANTTIIIHTNQRSIFPSKIKQPNVAITNPIANLYCVFIRLTT